MNTEEQSSLYHEAEEVLKSFQPYSIFPKGGVTYLDTDALKAMQKYAAGRVAKEKKETEWWVEKWNAAQKEITAIKADRDDTIKEKWETVNDANETISDKNEFIQSLQQSNQRLTAEVERLNNMITEKNSELYFSDHTNELKEALEQCMARINPNSKDTWDLKALYVAKKALNPLP